MDVSDAIVARRSVRNFARTPVPPDKLWKILDVGRRAPSGANRQPWLFIVVDDADIKGRIRRACESADREWWKVAPDWFLRWARSVGLSRRKSFLEQAPLLLCVFYDTTKPYSLESTWISIGYMALEATELRLGTLTYTPGNATAMNGILGVPKIYALAAILPIGVAREVLVPGGTGRRRKGLAGVTFHNRYGGDPRPLFRGRRSQGLRLPSTSLRFNL